LEQNYLRFPLEGRLEAALYGMGFELGDRIYREQIPLFSQLEDIDSDYTLKDALKTLDEDGDCGGFEFLTEVMKLSGFRRDIFIERVSGCKNLELQPLFCRMLSNDMFGLEYEVWSNNLFEGQIEPQINQFVKEDIDRVEHICVSYEEENNFLYFDVSIEGGLSRLGSLATDEGKEIKIEWDSFGEFCMKNKLEFEERLEKAKQTEEALREGQLHPYEAYRLVVDLVKP